MPPVETRALKKVNARAYCDTSYTFRIKRLYYLSAQSVNGETFSQFNDYKNNIYRALKKQKRGKEQLIELRIITLLRRRDPSHLTYVEKKM